MIEPALAVNVLALMLAEERAGRIAAEGRLEQLELEEFARQEKAEQRREARREQRAKKKRPASTRDSS